MLSSYAHVPFFQSGVSQGEGKAAAPRCSQQRSDASHYHPSALVPSLFVKAALPAKEGCGFFNTGTIYSLQLKIIRIVLRRFLASKKHPFNSNVLLMLWIVDLVWCAMKDSTPQSKQKKEEKKR